MKQMVHTMYNVKDTICMRRSSKLNGLIPSDAFKVAHVHSSSNPI